MKIFFDTEFTGLHQKTTLISIGLISEDNKRFYAEFTDYDTDQVNDWIQQNVVDKLDHPMEIDTDDVYMTGTTQDIKEMLKEWLSKFDEVEFVSDVCHYDMVLLINLIADSGEALDLPSNICPVCYDINQDIASAYSISQKEAFDMSRLELAGCDEQDAHEHNSLFDASVIKAIYHNLH